VRLHNSPSWAADVFSGSTPPYAVSAHKKVVAYLYGYPLAVHNSGPKTDKILWVVKDSGQGRLHIHGHPVGASHPRFSKTLRLNAATGIPSYEKVPAPGCWHFALTWQSPDGSHHKDTLNVRYLAHA
jgi:hypothetical protein